MVDPVLRSSSGAPLFRGDRQAYAGLFRLSTAVTPNLPEAAALLNWKADGVWDRAMIVDAAQQLLALGPRAVVLKGGHFGGRSDDLLLERTAHRERWYGAARLDRSARGTGCRFASALATRLALEESLPVAVASAKKQVRRYLLRAGAGSGR